MPKYKVDSPIKHDGQDYAVNDDIDLSAKAAMPLLDAGAIHEAVAVTAKKDNKKSADE